MKKLTIVLALMLTLAIALPAYSATIGLNIIYPAGVAGTTWQVTAVTSPDNAGIYGVGFAATGISSMTFRGPTQGFTNDEDFGITTYGFTTRLGPSGNIAAGAGSTNAFTTSQGLTDPPAGFIYGAGLTAGNANTLPPPAATGWTLNPSGASAYAVPILLFSGNKPAGGEIALSNFSGAVFKVQGAGAGQNLDTQPIVSIVPEPTSLVLMGIAGLGMVAVYRRKKVA